jgi:hypothetical protein
MNFVTVQTKFFLFNFWDMHTLVRPQAHSNFGLSKYTCIEVGTTKTADLFCRATTYHLLYYLHILRIGHNCLDLECSWSHRPQITCDPIRIKLSTSKLVLGTFLHCFLPWLVIILNSTPYPWYILYWMVTQNTSSATHYLSYELFYTFSLDIHLIQLSQNWTAIFL